MLASKPEIDFRRIRTHESSQNEGFEELCCQLYALSPPGREAEWTRKRGAGGDGGVEGYWTLENGEEHCLQSKYFFDLGESQRTQVTKSVEQMLKRHPNCTKYIVCLPFNLTDARKGNAWSQRRHWNALKERWKKISPSREIEFELWDNSKLAGFLSLDDPTYSGRCRYWFDNQFLSPDWFVDHLSGAIANLGPRYTPEMHVELPLQRRFSAIARDEAFWSELADFPELPESYSKNESIQKAESAARALVAQGQNAIATACSARNLNLKIDTAKECFRKAEQATQEIDLDESSETRSAWYKLKSSTRASNDHLEECHVDSSISSAFLILGQAGVGKSHLLADVAAQALAAGRPAVLLLGQQLQAGSAATFIKNALEIRGDLNEFLGALDSSAQSKGCRALFMVDALNEGAGIRIWPNELAGLINKFSKFPNVVLVVSCRSTYSKSICRNLAGGEFVEFWHQGFAGHEEAAAKVFLDRKGISRPDAPFLDPEFSNPLFLKTICERIEQQGGTSFPKGLRGVTQIFDYYHSAIVNSIEEKLDLDPDQHLVRQILEAFTATMVSAQKDYIPTNEALHICEKIRPSNGAREKSLLHHLKSEGLYSDDLIYSDDEDTRGQEVIRFTYERYLDHFRADRFISQCIDPNDLKSAFGLGGAFRILIGENEWKLRGVIFALSIQIPEKFNEELISLVEFDDDEDSYFGLTRTLLDATRDSILWRDPKKISGKTLDILNQHLGGFGPTVFEIVLRCATEPEHPFNAHMLHKNLLERARPQRDATWTSWLPSQWYDPEEGDVTPVWTLIDWAFNVDPSKVDDERAFLACLALCWMFTSPRRSLRDKATKAVVAILEKRVSVARRLVIAFDSVDDFYVLERVYAVVYACALHLNSADMKPLVRTVLNRVFRRPEHYDHLLLREYAFGIVEMAGRLDCLPRKIPESARSFVRQSKSPLEFPEPSEISNMKGDLPFAYSSVMGGDFGIYIMNDVFGFSPSSLELEVPATWGELKGRFLADLSERNPDTLRIVQEYISAKEQEFDFARTKSYRDYGQSKTAAWLLTDDGPIFQEVELPEYDERAHEIAKARLLEAKASFEGALTDVEQDHWRWLSGGNDYKSAAKFSRRMAKFWVLNRVKQLGWTEELFGQYERNYGRNGSRNDHDNERIGKKYQWIAYHELLAKIGDRYQYAPSNEESAPFLGAWQLGRRDIDPSFIHPGKLRKGKSNQAWWLPPLADVSEKLSTSEVSKWIRDTADLTPDFVGLEAHHPDTGRVMLTLDSYQMERERSERNFSAAYRSYSQFTHSIILESKHKDAFLASLRNISLLNVFTNPQDWSGYAFIGEYAWHPSWHSDDESFRRLSDYRQMDGIKYQPPIHNPYRSYTAGGSGYDHSLPESISISLPSPLLIDELGLTYNRRKFEYRLSDGTLAFLDPAAFSNLSSAALVDKEAISNWLVEKGYVIISSICHMKNYIGGNTGSYLGELVDCQLVCWDGIKRTGQRWTLLTESGPDEKLLRRAFAI